MSGRRKRLLAVSAVLGIASLAAFTAAPPAATGPGAAVYAVSAAQAGAQRVIAIGDIHGALDSLTDILQEVELVDEDLRWIGGDTILVQTGDYTDRGPMVRETMDLLMRLQGEAEAAGGQVHVVLANHEAMNLVNFYRDNSPADYSAFVDRDSEARQDEAFEAYVDVRTRRAEILRADEPQIDRDEWEQTHPLGYVERLEAYGPDGYYGRWLRERPTAVRVGDVLFMHAGVSPELAELDIGEINERIWDEIERFDETREDMVDAGLITPWADLVEIITGADEELVRLAEQYAPERGVRLSRSQQILAGKLQWVLGYQKWDLLAGDGLLWFRGLALWPEEEHLADVELILDRQDVDHIVVGHTTQASGIKSRFGGRVFVIDTGMLVDEYDGRPAALEIRDGTFDAIYIGERDRLYPGVGLAPSPWSLQPASFLTPHAAGAPETQRVLVGPDGEPLPLSDDEILEFMRTAEVVDMVEVGSGITKPRRVTLEQNGIRMRAIFHTVELRREQARIGDRMFAVFRDNWKNQIAAYRLGLLLAIDAIPPTVRRTIDGEEGSLQLWLENDGIMTDTDRIANKIYPEDVPAWLAQRWTMQVFDELVFNDDRHPRNILIDGEWRIWLIDHTRTFQRTPMLRDPARLTNVETGLWRKLNELTDAELADAVAELLDPDQISGLLARRRLIIEHFNALIEQNGTANVVYSMPDSIGIAA